MDTLHQSNESISSNLTYSSVASHLSNEKINQEFLRKERKQTFVFSKHHHEPKSVKKRVLKGLLQPKTWPNPFLQGQNKAENADLYKIFSILYGLVVFIGGVAFSISHTIIPREEGEDIIHLAAIYFTYLYWVSIIWIVFCIIDINRHKRKLDIHSPTTLSLLEKKPALKLELFEISDNDEEGEINSNSSDRSQSLDDISDIKPRYNQIFHRRQTIVPNGQHTLQNCVSRRRNTIVQRVIGYNYDDNSTAGGLYIRVGIGIFCLGTVIHSGLSILSNLENLVCLRWSAIMDDFSRLLFSFIQFFFIFKHSNLIIHAHENLARLAVMHVVVTNLCVWFRMVVIETKSQILEMSAHEMALGQLANPLVNQSMRTNHSFICTQAFEDNVQINSYINEGYMKLKPLLYPCTIEFSLMSLTLFFLIWENIGKTFTYKISDKASTKNVFMVNCHASIKGLFFGMIIFSCTVISVILYAVFRNKTGSDDLTTTTATVSSTLVTTTLPVYRNRSAMITSVHGPFTSISKTPKKLLYSIAIIEVVNLCLLIISLFSTIWALIKIRKLQYRSIATRFDNVLIIVSLTGIYLYSIFSAFALLNNKNSATWIAYVKIVIVILEFIEGTVHAFFILVALRKRLVHSHKPGYPAREIITLLIMLDLSLWFEETTTTTKNEANPFQLAFYHVIPWSIIAAIATPLQIFFRFHASVCLAHIWENMYTSAAYEPVAPHGL